MNILGWVERRLFVGGGGFAHAWLGLTQPPLYGIVNWVNKGVNRLEALISWCEIIGAFGDSPTHASHEHTPRTTRTHTSHEQTPRTNRSSWIQVWHNPSQICKKLENMNSSSVCLFTCYLIVLRHIKASYFNRQFITHKCEAADKNKIIYKP